jgi:hypothetical protein
MAKYRAKGGAFSGFGLAIIIFIVAAGLIGLTVWLIMKNTPPATCDVSVTSVDVSQNPLSGTSNYPVTVNFSGNGSNACVNAKGVTINGTITDSKSNTTPISTTDPVSLAKGQFIVNTTDPKSTVKLTYFLVNTDGSEGPTHSYP